MSDRQIVLDTETTGLEPSQGHRIIEIGCLELKSRRPTQNNFWHYLNPDREIDAGAIEVHGITNEFLADKQRFADIADQLLEYLRGAELVIHNAAFDVGFLDAEYARLGKATGNSYPRLAEICEITDTVAMARKKHPGQRVSLDALCKRYEIDNSRRELHGALLDAQLLADVYLLMTGGQSGLELSVARATGADGEMTRLFAKAEQRPTRVAVSDAERAAHDARVKAIAEASGVELAWR
ncbi:DNA polymerase III subunit epsilon [bacterium]|nr:DNA polymerase III subunit epsilon [bacterium]